MGQYFQHCSCLLICFPHNTQAMKKYYCLSILFLFQLSSFSQNLAEDFEGGTFPPIGWTTFRGTNALGTAQDWQSTTDAYTGTGAAFVRYENVTGGLAEDWLVTPLISLNGSNNLLSFFMKQSYGTDYGGIYDVRVSTGTQNNPSDFTVLDGFSELDFGTTYSQHSVNLSAYDGQNVYIAFVMTQDDGDDWFIDDISVDSTSSPITIQNLVIDTPGYQNLEYQELFTLDTLAEYLDIRNTQTTPDSGVISAGVADMVFDGSLNQDMIIQKYDKEGNIQWINTYDFGGYSDRAGIVKSTSDGGYLAGGRTADVATFVKLNSAGDIIWNKHYFKSSRWIDIYDFIETSDGYVFCGSDGTSSDMSTSNIFLGKIDLLGNIIWSKTITTSFVSIGFSLGATNDGNYVVGGLRFQGDNDPYLIKFDDWGNIIWSKRYHGNNYEFAVNIEVLHDNSIALVGGNTISAFAMKVNSQGDIIWSKSLDDINGMGLQGHSIVESNYTHDLHIAGITANTPNSMFYLSLDEYGNLYPGGKIYGTANLQEYTWTLTHTTDGGLFVSGIQELANDVYRPFNIKTDLDGNSLTCMDQNTDFQSTDYSFNVVNMNETFSTNSLSTVSLSGLKTAINTTKKSLNINIEVESYESSCSDTCNGWATVHVNGGFEPYSYQWNGQIIQYSDTVYGLCSGITSVEVTDTNGCSAVAGVFISDSSDISIIDSVINPLCFGLNTGEIHLTVNGSASPYSYFWSTGATGSILNNLSPGNYDVMITDGNECKSVRSILIEEPDELLTESFHQNSLCSGSDGKAYLFSTGGTTPYTYLWPSGETSPVDSLLSFGTYIVTITDLAGCEELYGVNISEISNHEISINSTLPSNCGYQNGAAETMVNGGVPPYTYLWSNGETTASISGLFAGEYYVSVTDAANCNKVEAVEIINDKPDKKNVCLVTVDSLTNWNLVTWEKQGDIAVSHYNIYRESSQSLNFQLIGSVSFNDFAYYIDSFASPNVKSWRYKISSVDSCGIESELSDYHKTIHLTINQGVGGEINLVWDHYEGFTFSTYDIYRYSDLLGWELLTNVANNLTSYTDFSPPQTSDLYYVVEAVNPDGPCDPSKASNYSSSRSNRPSKNDVGIETIPIAYFYADTTILLYEGNSIQFIDTSFYDPNSWSWTFEGGSPATSNLQNPIITYNAAGNYYVKLVASNGAGSDSTTHISYIKVLPSGSAPITDFNASSTSILIGDSINFYDLSANNPTSWSWIFSGGSPLTSSDQNPTNIKYNNIGTYEVVLSTSNNIGNDTETKIDYILVSDSSSTVGLKEDKSLNEFNVYPSPSDGHVSVYSTFSKSTNVTIKVTNTFGQVVYIKSLLAETGKSIFSLDLTRLSSGTYTVQLITEESKEVKQIMIK